MHRCLLLILSLAAFAQDGERVLYVEGTPRWEYRFLRNYLIEEPGLRVQCYLANADPGFPQESSPGLPALGGLPRSLPELAAYDTVILGDVPVLELGALVGLLPAWVEQGGSLLCIAGPLALPEHYLSGALADILPMTEAERVRREEADLRLDGRGDWPLPEAPPGMAEAWALTPRDGARTLLTVRDLPGAPPALVGWSVGKGAVLFQGFAESWRWREATTDALDEHYAACLAWLQQSRVVTRPVRLTLRDGNIIEGRLADFADRTYVLRLSDGQELRYREAQLRALEFLDHAPVVEEPRPLSEAELRAERERWQPSTPAARAERRAELVRNRARRVARVRSQAFVVHGGRRVATLTEEQVGSGVFVTDPRSGEPALLTARALALPHEYDPRAAAKLLYYIGLQGNYEAKVRVQVEMFVPDAASQGLSSIWMTIFSTEDLSLRRAVAGEVLYEAPQTVSFNVDANQRRVEGVRVARAYDPAGFALFGLDLERAFPANQEGRDRLRRIHGKNLDLLPATVSSQSPAEFDPVVLLAATVEDRVGALQAHVQTAAPISLDERFAPSFVGAPLFDDNGQLCGLVTHEDEAGQTAGAALGVLLYELDELAERRSVAEFEALLDQLERERALQETDPAPVSTRKELVKQRAKLIARVRTRSRVTQGGRIVAYLTEEQTGSGVFVDDPRNGELALLTARALALPHEYDLEAAARGQYYLGLGGDYEIEVEVAADVYAPEDEGETSTWMTIFSTEDLSLRRAAHGVVGYGEPQVTTVNIDATQRRIEGVRLARRDDPNGLSLFAVDFERAFPRSADGRARLARLHGQMLELRASGVSLGNAWRQLPVLLLGVIDGRIIPFDEALQAVDPLILDERFDPSLVGAPLFNENGRLVGVVTHEGAGRQIAGVEPGPFFVSFNGWERIERFERSRELHARDRRLHLDALALTTEPPADKFEERETAIADREQARKELIRDRQWIVGRVRAQAFVTKEGRNIAQLTEPVVGSGVFVRADGEERLLTARQLALPHEYDPVAVAKLESFLARDEGYALTVELAVDVYCPDASDEGATSVWMTLFESADSSLRLHARGAVEYELVRDVAFTGPLGRERRAYGVWVARPDSPDNWALLDLNFDRAFPDDEGGRAKLRRIHDRALPFAYQELSDTAPALELDDNVVVIGVSRNGRIIPYDEELIAVDPLVLDEPHDAFFLGGPLFDDAGRLVGLLTHDMQGAMAGTPVFAVDGMLQRTPASPTRVWRSYEAPPLALARFHADHQHYLLARDVLAPLLDLPPDEENGVDIAFDARQLFDELAPFIALHDESAMVVIDGGPFPMGSDDPSAPASGPAHTVVLPAFAIDRREVSIGEYLRFLRDPSVRAGAYDHPDNPLPGQHLPIAWRSVTEYNGALSEPVHGLSYYSAWAYARWCGKRLPTEQEWEKAASWGPDFAPTDKRAFPWGGEWMEERCQGKREEGPLPVGSHKDGASAWGVLQLAGNVAEWTTGAYQAYPGSAYEDEDFGSGLRVVRGGSYLSPDSGAFRTTDRVGLFPSERYEGVGFRCVRDLYER